MTFAPVLAAEGGSSSAGGLGFLVIVLLFVATYFLYRSLAKHLRRIPPTFDPPAGSAPPADPDRPTP